MSATPWTTSLLLADVPAAWRAIVKSVVEGLEFQRLSAFLVAEARRGKRILPARDDVFAALALTTPTQVRVVIVGQDPYHGPGQAHGLAFSVAPGVKVPPSLRNIFKELVKDVGAEPPSQGMLSRWADQGVLLLNTVLTVEQELAASHAGRGWEALTSAILAALAQRAKPPVFVLWGAHAQKLAKNVGASDKLPQVVSAHPSPLSASRGFFGSKPFTTTNKLLAARGDPPIDWRLP